MKKMKSAKREKTYHNIENTVGNVHTMSVSTGEQRGNNVDGNEVDDKDVASPSSNHVKVGQAGENSPQYRTSLHSSNPN
jgi:hypothetical protein